MTPQTIAVGQSHPSPDLVAEPSAGWYPETNTLLIVDYDMTPERAHQEWDGARLWLVPSGAMLVLVAQLATGDELEMPAALLASRPRPEWIDQTPGQDTRLPMTIVSVDCASRIVQRIHYVTTSAHFTRHLLTQAQRRWEQPITETEWIAAVEQYQHRYPTIKATIRAAVASTRLGQ